MIHINMPRFYGQRRCLEAWQVNTNHRALNRDDDSYLRVCPPCWQLTSPLEYIRSRVVTLDHPLMKTLGGCLHDSALPGCNEA